MNNVQGGLNLGSVRLVGMRQARVWVLGPHSQGLCEGRALVGVKGQNQAAKAQFWSTKCGRHLFLVEWPWVGLGVCN